MSRITPKIVCVLCVFLFLIASNISALAELKIGYIRPGYILENYEPYKEANRQLMEFQKIEEEKLQKEGEKLRYNVADAQKKALLMSEEILAQTREELSKQKEALDKTYDDLYKPGGIFEKKQQELVEPIIERVNEVLMRIGKDDGYDYILDAEKGVLFADEKHDISDYILEELKKGTPSTSTK